LYHTQTATSEKSYSLRVFGQLPVRKCLSVFDVNDKAIPKMEELEALSFWEKSFSLMIF
jgi:hypothetical protein